MGGRSIITNPQKINYHSIIDSTYINYGPDNAHIFVTEDDGGD